MRAHEFILEYKRDITANNFGDKLINALLKTPSHAIPQGVFNIYTIIDMAMHPNKYQDTYSSSMTLFGDKVNLNKNTANEILTKYKQQFVEGILRVIEDTDPTTHKEYVQWLVRMYVNGSVKIEDMNRGNALSIYDLGKKKKMIPKEYADINRFKTYKQFEDIMVNEIDMDAIEASNKPVDKGNSKVMYEDSSVRVIVPEDQEAACYYGQGTQWCTAATRGNNLFNHYNKTGPLYIIIPKHPIYNGEKYQFHFETKQYMNEQDEPVNMFDILGNYSGFRDYLRKNTDYLNDLIPFMTDEELRTIVSEMNWRIHSIVDEAIERHLEDSPSRYIAHEISKQLQPVWHSTPKDVRAATLDAVETGFGEQGSMDIPTPDITELPSIYSYMIRSRNFFGERDDIIYQVMDEIALHVTYGFKFTKSDDGKWKVEYHDSRIS